MDPVLPAAWVLADKGGEVDQGGDAEDGETEKQDCFALNTKPVTTANKQSSALRWTQKLGKPILHELRDVEDG